MATTEPVSEEEIEAALRTDPNYAVELVDAFYRERIWQYINWVTWSRLRPEEIKVVYQETMLAFIRRVREDDFDPAGPLGLVLKQAEVHARDKNKLKNNSNPSHSADV